MSKVTIVTSDFYCINCGNKGIPIARKRGAEREAGHLKKIYCIKCKESWNHVECKVFSHYTYDDFLIEKKYNNFDNLGNRKMTYGELKGLINNGKI
jgi:hypothetical protein